MRTDDYNNLSRVLGSSDQCLPLEQLVLALEGKRGVEAQANAETHLATCAYCESEFALFREFESPEIRPEEHADVQAIVAHLRRNSPVPTTAPWWKSLWSFKTLAPASFAVAALLTIAILVPRRHEPQLGSFPADGTFRSQRVEALSPIGAVKGIPAVLEWSPVKEARTYRVRLFEVDNTQLWEAEVQTATTRMPDPVRKRVVPLKRLNWQVTALDKAGNTIADSGTQSFTLEQPGTR